MNDTIYSEDCRSEITDRLQDAPQYFDFGCTDKRGRYIGAYIFTGTKTYAAIVTPKSEYYSFSTVRPGTYFYFCPQAARDGKHYGACQHDRMFHTKAERDAAIRAYLKAAEARAAKKQA